MSKMTKAEQQALDRIAVIIDDVQSGLADIRQSPAVRLSVTLTKLARALPYGTDPIMHQLYRALNSVGANIVEGFGRGPSQARTQFLLIARGSAEEALVHAECVEWSEAHQIQLLICYVEQMILRYVTD
jgi:four helix bundle protein